MMPSKYFVFLCFCCCVMRVHSACWRGLNPLANISTPVWLTKMQSIMSPGSSIRHNIPGGKGPYSVGCTDLMFKPTREGSFLRLYYPSQDDKDQKNTVWIPNQEYFTGLMKFLTRHQFWGKFLNLLFGSVKIPAKWEAPFKSGEKYPLIIFSHGLGAFRTIYSAIGMDLASHGFIVAAVEHRDDSAAATYYFNETLTEKTWLYYKNLEEGDNEYLIRHSQVLQRANECRNALDLILDINSGKSVKNELGLKFKFEHLKDAIDPNQVAVMGHSFGGATVIQTLSQDKRFRCGIALDAWMLPLNDQVSSRVPQPLLFINSEKFQDLGSIQKMRALYQPGTERKMITIKGSVHQNFADFTFVTDDRIGKWLMLKGDINSNLALDLSNEASLAFLQEHLGLQRDYDQWAHLLDGKDENLIPGSPFDEPHL
ncbi:platelet-activating factor acetylhydrolase [Tachyglossus aculeatus]|uniref:platelet-activating factor acetylhydrolase n=1 Tax=Tachyglossus aculeatus TaxID=9261 RepID=UPI0018F764B5|nr:platelet-activating factor acetylhydrolase [Tachyglossus aculeatus]XP_038607671.1 platelet-activating factor acetylhydrolase [Tachyglossus aculeatus]XP_038607672.1 platelet-activating factor acetylhydrolase [Tachyglossus aculeatus]XP_038607673.1 platelet-activating factor acetylhydrolase [Tachyglossus aculeatus]XP_038607674.1 platelet-activating factor acetylhydrolase [Tachyglossus aculeatus]